MEIPLPATSLSLELTISSSPPPPPPGEGGGRMRNLDMNQIPEDGGEDQQWMSLMSSSNTSPSYSTMDLDNYPLDDGRGGGGSASITSSGSPPRKKLRLSKLQSQLLEDSFRLNPSLNPIQKEALAMKLNLTPRQVEVWFQNRRARSKLKQTEMECEYLRRWFTSLTEQNRYLQKEVEELRASKVDPPTILLPNSSEPLPASALSMCPHCQRITASTPSPTKEPLDGN